MTDQQERVAAGIAWLDANPKVPSDWREHVRPDSLSVVNPNACVLAQLAAAYGWGEESGLSYWTCALAYLWPDTPADDTALRTLGFLIMPSVWDEGRHVYVDPDGEESTDATRPPGTLTAAWREALRKAPAV